MRVAIAAPQWPGQARSLVQAAMADAEGGVLVVDADGDASGGPPEAIESLVEEMRASLGAPVVILIAEPSTLAELRGALPALDEVFGQRWDMPAYTSAARRDRRAGRRSPRARGVGGAPARVRAEPNRRLPHAGPG